MPMDTSQHTLTTLFAQLGLPDDKDSITTFIKTHSPLGDKVPLAEAQWWNESQKRFLREALQSDSDWAMAVDELNSRLRNQK